MVRNAVHNPQCSNLLPRGGGGTPRVLGRQLPPPPPLGDVRQRLAAKGVALRRAWGPEAPDAP